MASSSSPTSTSTRPEKVIVISDKCVFNAFLQNSGLGFTEDMFPILEEILEKVGSVPHQYLRLQTNRKQLRGPATPCILLPQLLGEEEAKARYSHVFTQFPKTKKILELVVSKKACIVAIPADSPFVASSKASENQGKSVLVSRKVACITQCAHCGEISSDLMLCSACKISRYCSKECQTADWKTGHKTECKEWRKARESKVIVTGDLEANQVGALFTSGTAEDKEKWRRRAEETGATFLDMEDEDAMLKLVASNDALWKRDQRIRFAVKLIRDLQFSDRILVVCADEQRAVHVAGRVDTSLVLPRDDVGERAEAIMESSVLVTWFTNELFESEVGSGVCGVIFDSLPPSNELMHCHADKLLHLHKDGGMIVFCQALPDPDPLRRLMYISYMLYLNEQGVTGVPAGTSGKFSILTADTLEKAACTGKLELLKFPY